MGDETQTPSIPQMDAECENEEITSQQKNCLHPGIIDEILKACPDMREYFKTRHGQEPSQTSQQPMNNAEAVDLHGNQIGPEKSSPETNRKPDMPEQQTSQQHTVEFYDACIVNAEADEDLALDVLEKMKKLELKNNQHPKVCLYDKEEFGGLEVGVPNTLVERCVLILPLLTDNFAKDKKVQFVNNETIASTRFRDKPVPHWQEHCVRPLHTQVKSVCKYTVPSGLNSIRSYDVFNFDSASTKRKLTELFEHILQFRPELEMNWRNSKLAELEENDSPLAETQTRKSDREDNVRVPKEQSSSEAPDSGQKTNTFLVDGHELALSDRIPEELDPTVDPPQTSSRDVVENGRRLEEPQSSSQGTDVELGTGAVTQSGTQSLSMYSLENDYITMPKAGGVEMKVSGDSEQTTPMNVHPSDTDGPKEEMDKGDNKPLPDKQKIPAKLSSVSSQQSTPPLKVIQKQRGSASGEKPQDTSSEETGKHNYSPQIPDVSADDITEVDRGNAHEHKEVDDQHMASQPAERMSTTGTRKPAEDEAQDMLSSLEAEFGSKSLNLNPEDLLSSVLPLEKGDSCKNNLDNEKSFDGDASHSLETHDVVKKNTETLAKTERVSCGKEMIKEVPFTEKIENRTISVPLKSSKPPYSDDSVLFGPLEGVGEAKEVGTPPSQEFSKPVQAVDDNQNAKVAGCTPLKPSHRNRQDWTDSPSVHPDPSAPPMLDDRGEPPEDITQPSHPLLPPQRTNPVSDPEKRPDPDTKDNGDSKERKKKPKSRGCFPFRCNRKKKKEKKHLLEAETEPEVRRDDSQRKKPNEVTSHDEGVLALNMRDSELLQKSAENEASKLKMKEKLASAERSPRQSSTTTIGQQVVVNAKNVNVGDRPVLNT